MMETTVFIFLVLSKSILDAEEDICGGGGAVDRTLVGGKWKFPPYLVPSRVGRYFAPVCPRTNTTTIFNLSAAWAEFCVWFAFLRGSFLSAMHKVP